ncbi:peptidoglycan-binding protein [Acidobacteria bacterium AH-259-A15]|nr:peptidoglycan-binding protein [Acidobacteria bacterium AH-259-A15]
MSRVLFARGARGEIIKEIQRSLQETGFDPRGIDGIYGKGTEKAVTEFQQEISVEQTGKLDETTWSRLTDSSVPSLRDRCLQLTATFEGHDFSLAQGNWDGAGITWGIIGFTLIHGGIRKIVSTIHQEAPDLLGETFEDTTDELLEVVRANRSDQLAWADRVSLGKSKVRLAEPWRSRFRRFGQLKEVQALQIRLADEDYFQPALQTAKRFNLKTELGISLAFDIHVQNGGVKTRARQQIEKDLDEHQISGEKELRVVISNAVADHSKKAFREDVRSRKLTIATGVGRVHGSLFLLPNWGLDDLPAR